MDEVCRVFNLDKDIVEKYIQFGGVFNLLHAAASYLRIHQKGFGAVGVSGKYGKRSKQRYPIFWSLPKIGSLPNPDPADTAERDTPKKQKKEEVAIDSAMEANRGILRCRAQEWAGLNADPEVSFSLVFVQHRPLFLIIADGSSTVLVTIVILRWHFRLSDFH
jgi:alpha-1,3-glucan synthase